MMAGRLTLRLLLAVILVGAASCCPVTTLQKWFGGGRSEARSSVDADTAR